MKKAALFILLGSLCLGQAVFAQPTTENAPHPIIEKWYLILRDHSSVTWVHRTYYKNGLHAPMNTDLKERYVEIDNILKENPILVVFTPGFSSNGHHLNQFSNKEFSLLKTILSSLPHEISKRPQPLEAKRFTNMAIAGYRQEEQYIYLRYQQGKNIDFSILFNLTKNLVTFYKGGYIPLYLNQANAEDLL